MQKHYNWIEKLLGFEAEDKRFQASLELKKREMIDGYCPKHNRNIYKGCACQDCWSEKVYQKLFPPLSFNS
jgi:hypothetical protein